MLVQVYGDIFVPCAGYRASVGDERLADMAGALPNVRMDVDDHGSA
jgi:hypothetical protein